MKIVPLKLRQLVITAVAVVGFCQLSWASELTPLVDDVTFGPGSDCQDVVVSYDSDEKKIFYEFLDYEAFTDVASGIYRDSKRCTVNLPIDVPEGYQVAIEELTLEYGGFISEGGQGDTSLRYRFLGETSDGVAKSFPEGPVADEITFVPDEVLYSECGKDVTLELRSRMTVRAPSDGSEDSDIVFEDGIGGIGGTKPLKHYVACRIVWIPCAAPF